MEHYKTTHETDWRRVRWVHDEDYDPAASLCYAHDKETQAAIDVELAGLQSGALVVLGAIVETRCPHCKEWQERDALWGIVVDADEDLEAWGAEFLDIPEDSLGRRAHVGTDCEESPSGDTSQHKMDCGRPQEDYKMPLPSSLPPSAEVGGLPDDDLRKHADYIEDCTGRRPVWCLSHGKARRIPDRLDS